MKIPEMHVVFRQFAQQMGMQRVRAILPEQIDIVLNTAIVDIANQIVRDNVGISNDRVVTDNAKISQINALRTLYKVKELDLLGGDSSSLPFKYDAADYFNGRYSSNDAYSFPEAMLYADFALNYCKATTGWKGTTSPVRDSSTPFTTNYYPVRLIDDGYLADTLNDFVLKNRLRSPIAVMYSKDGNKHFGMDMYIDAFDKTSGLLANSLAPYKFRMSYVAYPAKVKYSEDIAGENVDCDLPEYLHSDIVKRAVDIYRVSLNNSLYSAQQRADAQNAEDYRNEGQ
jgi:hypothetical protein